MSPSLGTPAGAFFNGGPMETVLLPAEATPGTASPQTTNVARTRVGLRGTMTAPDWWVVDPSATGDPNRCAASVQEAARTSGNALREPSRYGWPNLRGRTLAAAVAQEGMRRARGETRVDARATRPAQPREVPARDLGRDQRRRLPRPPPRRIRRDPHHRPEGRDHRRLGGRHRTRHGESRAFRLGHAGDDHRGARPDRAGA